MRKTEMEKHVTFIVKVTAAYVYLLFIYSIKFISITYLCKTTFQTINVDTSKLDAFTKFS